MTHVSIRKFIVPSLFAAMMAATLAADSFAQDWPQWRGPNRDGKAAAFAAPESWPEELKRAWGVEVGNGVATPALVGDRLYVFARQGDDEIMRCISTADGTEIWQEKYESEPVRGNAGGFPGPRSSPAVAEGKVVALGAQGTVSCWDAESGKLLWRNEKTKGRVPRFATSSSPIVAGGLAIVQIGNERDGGIAAYDLASGDEKWKWSKSGPAYGSPVAIKVGDIEAIVAPTDRRMVILAAADGKELWNISYSQGRYNAATPLVDGQTLIYAGPNRGSTARKIERQGDAVDAQELWTNTESSVQFNTPVIKDGLLFGLSNLDSLFCVDTTTGKTIWNEPLGGAARGGEQRGGERSAGQREGRDAQRSEQRRDAQQAEGQQRGEDAPRQRPNAQRQRPGGERGQRGGRGGRGFGGRGGGGRGGYGSVVDAGSVLVALTPSGELTVFAPGKEFKKLAEYKVAERGTYAYPIASGKRLFIKDQDSLTLWVVP
jgi:outer membrane protein assembly factor BamB